MLSGWATGRSTSKGVSHPQCNAEPSSSHRVLWFSEILSHRPLEPITEPIIPLARISPPECGTHEQAHTKEERTRKAPYTGCGYGRRVSVGCWNTKVGAARGVQGTVTTRAGLRKEWQSWAAKTNSTYFPPCLRLALTLGCLCNTIHVHPRPHQQLCPYGFKTFQKYREGTLVVQHDCSLWPHSQCQCKGVCLLNRRPWQVYL